MGVIVSFSPWRLCCFLFPSVIAIFRCLSGYPHVLPLSISDMSHVGKTTGNEALFCKTAPAKDKALLGMDLVRLALERAHTARQAIDIIAG